MRIVPLALAAVLVVVVARNVRRVPKTFLAAGLVVAGALIVYGVGVIDPPNIEELLLDIGDAFGNWAYLLVGALAFLETGAFVGLVAPGETAVIAGGVFAGQGNLQLFVLLGYFSWRNIDRAAEIASRGTLALGSGVTIAIVALLAYRFLRTPEQRAAARRWLRERRASRNNVTS